VPFLERPKSADRNREHSIMKPIIKIMRIRGVCCVCAFAAACVVCGVESVVVCECPLCDTDEPRGALFFETRTYESEVCVRACS
jgi:hypothetical protein